MNEESEFEKYAETISFDRDEWRNALLKVFGSYDSDLLDELQVLCMNHKRKGDFLFTVECDEYYIIDIEFRTIISWCKFNHFGRSNECTNTKFTIEDLEKFFTRVKTTLEKD